MAQLWKTLDVVPPQVELGQMLTVGDVLQRGYVIGTEKQKWQSTRLKYLKVDLREITEEMQKIILC